MHVDDYIYFSGDLVRLLLTLAFSLAIGLELRQYHLKNKSGTLYGTDRTHVFVGLAGFVLYRLNKELPGIFWAGEAFLILSLMIYYYNKIIRRGQFGMTTLWTTFITYHLAAMIYSFPLWTVFAVVSVILLFMQLKDFFWKLSRRFDEDEFITLAKFLLMSGTLLPLLSRKPVSPQVPVSPFDIWLAVVVVSGISYLAYWLKKFIFPGRGILLSGILGGMYSSTATTLVLARKSREDPEHLRDYAAAIVVATGMMFVRIAILALVLHPALGKRLLMPLVILAGVSFGMTFIILRIGKSPVSPGGNQTAYEADKNPLELGTAFIFALLFVFFSVLTRYVLATYGSGGLKVLSLVVGFTDIDPFLLGLFTGHFEASLNELADATLIAAASNNLLKMLYAFIWGHRAMRKIIVPAFLMILAATVLAAIWI